MVGYCPDLVCKLVMRRVGGGRRGWIQELEEGVHDKTLDDWDGGVHGRGCGTHDFVGVG